MRHLSHLSCLVLALGTCAACSPALADDGFQWAAIGAVGNQAYFGRPGLATYGRGRVDYHYNISKLEITTGQWLEFTNTFSTQTDAYNFTKFGPTYWGASLDTRYTGPGVKYKLRNDPNAAMRPVGGISWRDAARYCNWLHNGKSSDLSSLITGAYDTTTFGTNPDGSFTDALAHLAGAKYWIPTLDEWMKAVYYDPNRFGNNLGGWWAYSNMSDSPGISGLPGVGTTSAGVDLANSAQWAIPLGAYPQSLSPWGLLDTSGGAAELSEGFAPANQPRERFIVGAAAGVDPVGDAVDGQLWLTWNPQLSYPDAGLRLASSVPGPSTFAPIVGAFFTLSIRRRS